jgi:hypothetical protein
MTWTNGSDLIRIANKPCNLYDLLMIVNKTCNLYDSTNEAIGQTTART